MKPDEKITMEQVRGATHCFDARQYNNLIDYSKRTNNYLD